MKELMQNGLLDTRRGLLKTFGLSVLAVAGLSNRAAASTGIDFQNSEDLDDEVLFAEVRRQLVLGDKLVYLNTGTLGPAPKLVLDKIKALMDRLEANPAIENFGPMGREMEAVRGKAANFLSADEDEIILTRNTTEGINIVCSAINWEAGDEILTTNHEHGGAETGLNFLAANNGAVVRKMTMPYPAESKEQLVNLVKDHLTDKTKMVLLSHIETVTGLRWPIKEVAEILKDRDILFIVDGAQAPGMVKVDLHDLGCDVYACSGHKWIMGPKETGILYLKKDIQNRINNVFMTGGYNAYSASSGTRNAPTIIGFGDVMDWHMAIGRERIEQRCLKLAEYCRDQLAKVDGVTLISADDPELSTAIISFSLDESISNRDVFMKMRDHGITIKRLPQYNGIRISNHLFTTNKDVDLMIELLKTLI